MATFNRIASFADYGILVQARINRSPQILNLPQFNLFLRQNEKLRWSYILSGNRPLAPA